MGTAVGALDLDPPHEEASILLLAYVLLEVRRPETRPAGPRVELRPAGQELLPAYGAQVDPGLVVVPVFSGERALGPSVDADLVLLRRQLLPELRLVQLLHGVEPASRGLKVSSLRRRHDVRPDASVDPPRLHVRDLRVLLPQGHASPRGILEDCEPSLAHDVGFRRDDLPY